METNRLQDIKNKYNIIGNNEALNAALTVAVAIAPTDIPVLVVGESGVGKETIPQIIHQNSLRRNGKYFVVNCGAIPEGTVESELFGHEKGAFTGAIESRKGYFEEANGGTIFLDEIAELPMSVQAKLLRVMQYGVFKRVGSSKDLTTNVRIVAATNKNLVHEISKDKFREDLYYRLNGVKISLPSLRERKEDINLLFRKFASDFSYNFRTPRVELTEDAAYVLRNYRWPGNIRQLKNVTEVVCQLETYGKNVMPDKKCFIDDVTLKKYLPEENTTLMPTPVVTNSSTESNSMDDGTKEKIIGAIFQLTKEVEYLKKDVEYLKSLSSEKPQLPIPNNENHVHTDVEDPDEQDITGAIPIVSTQMEEGEDTQSISDLTKTLIEKTLKKHNGNRQETAKELGISARTLYRKIKALGLN